MHDRLTDFNHKIWRNVKEASSTIRSDVILLRSWCCTPAGVRSVSFLTSCWLQIGCYEFLLNGTVCALPRFMATLNTVSPYPFNLVDNGEAYYSRYDSDEKGSAWYWITISLHLWKDRPDVIYILHPQTMLLKLHQGLEESDWQFCLCL